MKIKLNIIIFISILNIVIFINNTTKKIFYIFFKKLLTSIFGYDKISISNKEKPKIGGQKYEKSKIRAI